jgi:hypothetical protein
MHYWQLNDVTLDLLDWIALDALSLSQQTPLLWTGEIYCFLFQFPIQVLSEVLKDFVTVLAFYQLTGPLEK